MLTSPLTAKMDDALTVFLDNTIVSQNSGEKTGDNFITADYKILGTKKFGTETTVYLWVLYQEWTFDPQRQNTSVNLRSHRNTIKVMDACYESFEKNEVIHL